MVLPFLRPNSRPPAETISPTPFFFFSFFFIISGFSLKYCCGAAAMDATSTNTVGINYGMVADNLPSPAQVVRIIQSISVTKAKIYNSDSSVLRVFGNTGISIIVGVGNEDIAALTDFQTASNWVQQHIAVYLPGTRISAIAVGNEVFTGNDTELMSNLLPAMRNLHSALVTFGLDRQIAISTPQSLAILANSYPPSAGMFVSALINSYMKPLLAFISQTGAPFMINAYPFFAYKADPTTISLQYALFQSNPGVRDRNTGLVYYNLLDAQVDAVYSALQALGYWNVRVIVTETGWPSAGDWNEPGANLENAQAYNSNLINRVSSRRGTPLRPNLPLEAYIFALFNEDSKPGPLSERHYGLFQPDGSKVYDFGLDHPISSAFYIVSSSCPRSPEAMLCRFVVLLVSFVAASSATESTRIHIRKALIKIDNLI